MSPSRVITLGWRGISRRGITRRRRGITSGGIAPSAWCHAVSANFQHPTHYARSHALLAAWHSWAHARTAARQRSALRARAGLGARRARAARHSGDERARVSRRVLASGHREARGRRRDRARAAGGRAQASWRQRAVPSSTSSRATARPSSERGVLARSRASSARRACFAASSASRCSRRSARPRHLAERADEGAAPCGAARQAATTTITTCRRAPASSLRERSVTTEPGRARARAGRVRATRARVGHQARAAR